MIANILRNLAVIGDAVLELGIKIMIVWALAKYINS